MGSDCDDWTFDCPPWCRPHDRRIDRRSGAGHAVACGGVRASRDDPRDTGTAGQPAADRSLAGPDRGGPGRRRTGAGRGHPAADHGARRHRKRRGYCCHRFPPQPRRRAEREARLGVLGRCHRRGRHRQIPRPEPRRIAPAHPRHLDPARRRRRPRDHRARPRRAIHPRPRQWSGNRRHLDRWRLVKP